MKQVTLRFPKVGYERLQRMCGRYGISIRSLFEASALAALEDEHDPERHDVQIMMWETAVVLEASETFRAQPRHTLVITLEDGLHARVQDACRRFGVSINAAFALVVMPWPLESPPECVAFRRENIHRIVTRARQLDAVRGRGRRGPEDDFDGMPPDEWRDAIRRVQTAATTTHVAIERTMDLMRIGLKEHQAGRPRPEIIKRLIDFGGVEARHAMEAACDELLRSMHAYRGVAARVLIDEAGMTHSEVATLFGVSRQMVARLYRGAEETPGRG